jgi:hypothetical protein
VVVDVELTIQILSDAAHLEWLLHRLTLMLGSLCCAYPGIDAFCAELGDPVPEPPTTS